MNRGKWSGKRTCPVCRKLISKRGFAWAKHEATHPELLIEKRKAERIWNEAVRLAGLDVLPKRDSD